MVSDKEIEAAKRYLPLATDETIRVALEAAAPQQSGPVLPKLENCGTYFAKDNAGQWHYINHAGTWQGCPPPFPQPSGTVEVKPLEWKTWDVLHMAPCPFGEYRIEDQGENWKGDRYWLGGHSGQRLGKFSTLEAAKAAAQADYERRILSSLTAGKPEQHPDDEAVDRFAAAMKAKLKWEREERGRYGWNDPEVCSEEYLAKLLIEHLAKGNDGNFEDVANFCMMLHQRGAHPRVLADALTAGGGDE